MITKFNLRIKQKNVSNVLKKTYEEVCYSMPYALCRLKLQTNKRTKKNSGFALLGRLRENLCNKKLLKHEYSIEESVTVKCINVKPFLLM